VDGFDIPDLESFDDMPELEPCDDEPGISTSHDSAAETFANRRAHRIFVPTNSSTNDPAFVADFASDGYMIEHFFGGEVFENSYSPVRSLISPANFTIIRHGFPVIYFDDGIEIYGERSHIFPTLEEGRESIASANIRVPAYYLSTSYLSHGGDAFYLSHAGDAPQGMVLRGHRNSRMVWGNSRRIVFVSLGVSFLTHDILIRIPYIIGTIGFVTRFYAQTIIDWLSKSSCW
jgi:hypothetical protein